MGRITARTRTDFLNRNFKEIKIRGIEHIILVLALDKREGK
tara:strand:+ start:923 stop:1045 length:123 start_codon:yes stop_codon:yes gene_type:complete